MSVFASYQVRDATNAMSFEYDDLRSKNITLYIKIAQTDIDTLKSLIRVLLESIAKNLMTKESKKLDERIYLVLDEFIRFGKMPFLLEMPALCRSYGIVPLYITQSYGLIKKYYGEDDLKTMTDTIAFQILFKMNDADSAENVSKQIGKYTREARSHSTKDGAIAFGGNRAYYRSRYFKYPK
ncbi:coupling protein VirD4, ATPase required for T-DNA transfer [Helicobacter cinaedi]|nr:coupling protein VirD4, ATPase required for T-DNA transfer [Helicobacter cinaedi]